MSLEIDIHPRGIAGKRRIGRLVYSGDVRKVKIVISAFELFMVPVHIRSVPPDRGIVGRSSRWIGPVIQEDCRIRSVGDEIFVEKVRRAIGPMLLVMRKGKLMWERLILMHDASVGDDKVAITGLRGKSSGQQRGPMVTAPRKFEIGIIAHVFEEKRGILIKERHRGIESLGGVCAA